MSDRLIGQQIDHYRVTQHIAQGGMADVYLAEDVTLQRPVALKVMLANLAQDPDLIARFHREARTVAQLQHPNIVQIYTSGVALGGRPYLAMQFVGGGSLQQWLAQLTQRGQRLEPRDVLALLRPIASALDEAHRAGIVHRDLKPSNILLRRDGTPILTDLGIAAVQTATTRLTRTGSVMGTPHYMSPEQAKGSDVDGRSDIYSLGIILYEMLAGTVPFDADNSLAVLHQHLYEPPPPLTEKRPGLATATYQLVEICLQKEPTARFQTAVQLVQAIDEALTAETTGKRRTPLSVAPVTERTRRPLPQWVYAAGGAGVMLLIVLAGFLLFRPEPSPEETPGTAVPAADVDAPTPLMVADAATAAPLPTNTSIPTFTPLPTMTETAVPTTTPLPTHTPLPTATPLPAILPLPTAASSSPSGRIAFTCFMDSHDEICTVPATGGSVSRLTTDPATDFYPSFSPDGGTIYFSSRRDGGFYVYSMAVNGSNQQRFNSSLGGYYAPAVSPDGRQMAVTIASGGEQHVWVMNLDGSNARQLSSAGKNNVDPVWSRDGTQIAFSSDRDAAEGQMAHYLMNADGSNVRKLETGLSDLGGRSDWSPDGKWLAFYAGPSSDRDIYLVATDGSVVYQLTDGGGNLAPCFSPDGGWITFTSYRDGDAEIYIMRADGSEVTQLTFNGIPDYQPRWGR
ncbi:MAG: protein kinase [Ardenticatenaceae bacterium]|nr:protein kinase [Ardenticatenaceae bacterium]MCB8990445.1 protein kinase [Ardenticatenaceae bacterium]MCB9003459.1 protein kinase [Ardenticatenaceae bacterium]